MRIPPKAALALRLAGRWMATGMRSRANEEIFEGVEHYCMFVGYPRSGHTLIGALLDAHPQIVVGFETAAMLHLWARFDRKRLYQMILDSARHGGEHRWVSTGGEYVYHVNGMWQGRFDRLRVIGDKQAEGATLRIRANPSLLHRLRDVVQEPRILHVVRNPFDNITTMARRAARSDSLGEIDLANATDRYFKLCETVGWIREEARPGEVLTVFQEDFIADPARQLERICCWLDLESTSGYLEACASIVWEKPHRSREEIRWSPDLRESVRRRSTGFGFLARYFEP